MHQDAKAQAKGRTKTGEVAGLIRLHLSSQDIESARIAETADIGTELVLGMALLGRQSTVQLAEWQTAVAHRRNVQASRLADLYTPASAPGFFCHTVFLDRRETAEATAAVDPERAAEYVRALARTRQLTPFTRALADGQAAAFSALGRAVAEFQAAAIDPYRSQIASSVASSAADMTARIARLGVGNFLGTLHPGVRRTGSTLAVGTASKADIELDGRILLVRPTVLAAAPIVSQDLPGFVVLHIPTVTTLVTTRVRRTDHRNLGALLGPARAAALVAISNSPALTTGQLADALNLSASAASRHAAVLREAGLITTCRSGVTVHHTSTALGNALITRPVAPPPAF